MTLISTADAAQLIESDTVVILQVTVFVPGLTPTGEDAYREGHIPGAILFDLDAIGPEDPIKPHRKPEPDELAKILGALGVTANDQIIIYDCWGQLAAARLWWMLKDLGHPHLAVLDGGLVKWKLEGRPCSTHALSRPSTTYKRSAQASAVSNWVGREEVQELSSALQRGQATEMLIDARARDRFSGAAPDIWPNRRQGHIPGAKNMPFTDLLDAETKTFKSVDELKQQVSDLGLEPFQKVVCSCGSGVTACVIALALEHIKHKGHVQIYDGSWAEWGHENSPTAIEKG